jgi:hypothetical protein
MDNRKGTSVTCPGWVGILGELGQMFMEGRGLQALSGKKIRAGGNKQWGIDFQKNNLTASSVGDMLPCIISSLLPCEINYLKIYRMGGV